ncbi:MAG: ATP-binding protein [Planctomycetota bacterium]
MATTSSDSRSVPPSAIRVTAYADLKRYLTRFAEGKLNLVILLGRPGTGKTTAAKEVLGLNTNARGPLYIEGHMQPFGLYQALWRHCDRPVILDDLDRLYTHPDCLRLLKALCNSRKIKSLSWVTQRTQSAEEVPASFETTSSVLLISNTWRSVNDSLQALEDRAIILEFQPDNREVHRYVGEWFDDPEVYRFIGEHVELAPCLSLRYYDKGRMLNHAGFSDWHQTLIGMMIPDRRLALIVALKHDRSLRSDRERVDRFMEQTGLSRPTYYRLKRQIKSLGGLEISEQKCGDNDDIRTLRGISLDDVLERSKGG